jgi:hypothetical protein
MSSRDSDIIGLWLAKQSSPHTCSYSSPSKKAVWALRLVKSDKRNFERFRRRCHPTRRAQGEPPETRSSLSLRCFSEMQEAPNCLHTALSFGFVGIGPAVRRRLLRRWYRSLRDENLFGRTFLDDDRFPMFRWGRKRLRCRCRY